MALTDLQLLTQCANFTLAHAAETGEQIVEQLETSGATRLVNALRMLRLQKAILVVGMFSLFESLLQDQQKWREPFKELTAYLIEHGEAELAGKIVEYDLAINVLKHGKGRSYEKLLTMRAALEFKVGEPAQPFDEGDISEVAVLVDADDRFVRRSAELIEQALFVIQTHEPITVSPVGVA